MKRVILLILVMLFSSYAFSAELISNYDDFKNEMMTEFVYGDYETALEYYRDICKMWPKATDRRGNIDLYGIYCEARVEMENVHYTEAIDLFSVLDSNFPSMDGKETAGELMFYCKGERYLMTGLTDEAMICFIQCINTLDAGLILSRIGKGRETTIESVSVVTIESDAAAIKWTDVSGASEVDYYVTYYPETMVQKAKTVKATGSFALLNDMIPSTDYTVFVTPFENGEISGASSKSIVLTTKAAPIAKSGARITDTIIYSYNRNQKEKLNFGKDNDAFFEKVINENKSIRPYYDKLESGSDIRLSGAGIALSENGYAIRCKYQYTQRKPVTLNVLTVLRPAALKTGNSNDDIMLSGIYTKAFTTESDMGQGSFYCYLDGMLEEMYEFNENQWPYGTMIMDVFINGSLEKEILVNLTAES